MSARFLSGWGGLSACSVANGYHFACAAGRQLELGSLRLARPLRGPRVAVVAARLAARHRWSKGR
eukprot:7670936-Alexandrium_andersonii.AAC.1